LAGIAVFFATHDVRWMLAGAAIHGFAQSGGDIIWQLWVTKIAPPDRVSHYMSLHTLNTGIRGVVAPFAGYWILRHTQNPQMVGLASVVGMAAAILFFFRVKDDGRLSGRLRPEDLVAPSVRATDGDPAT
jgi:MFS family permease